jgi:fatty-acyl-CoA synthase
MGAFAKILKTHSHLDSVLSDTKYRLTYKDFYSLYQQFHHQLNPLNKGSLVTIHLTLTPLEKLAALLACMDLDLPVAPMYENMSTEESSLFTERLQPSAILQSPKQMLTQKNGSWVHCETGGIIFSTSGTTGQARFVYMPLSHILANATEAILAQNICARSHLLAPLTLAHTGGVNMQTLPALIAGASMDFISVGQHHWQEKLFNDKITHSILVPHHLKYFFRSTQRLKRKKALTVLTGSVPVGRHFFEQARQHRWLRLLSVYGMTEVGPFICYTDSLRDMSWMQKESTLNSEHFPLGQFIPNYEAISSLDGELMIRGPGVNSYLSPSADGHWQLESCALNGWLATGDMAFEQDGLWTYQGRKSRQINLSGYKIQPEEVEDILLQHPAVERAYVYPKIDPDLHQIPCVDIVLKQKIPVHQLKAYLKKRMTSLKVPRQWRVVEHLMESHIHKTQATKIKAS